MPLRLRYYQREALAAADLAIEAHRAGLLVSATGTGKTTIFSRLIERRLSLQERVLVLAHRTELIEQAANRLVADTELTEFDVGIEQASRRSSPAHRAVVASVQTMKGKRLAGFAPDAFDGIVVDEAHHSPASTYRKIFEHFGGAWRIGVTATPDRLDGRGLAKAFHSVAFAYEIRDAIDDGYLVPIRAKIVLVDDIDLSNVRRTAGDLNESDLDDVLMRQKAIQGIVKPTLDLSADRPTLIFANSVAHAHSLAKGLNIYREGCARALDGGTPAEVRRDVLGDFRAQRFQYLVNCALFTEGVDLPLVSCVVMGRPTSSRALYTQMAGRGTRCLGADYEESLQNGKADLLILDMVGNAGKHKLVCALDILDSAVDEKVARNARKKAIEAGDDGVEIEGALREAEQEVVEQLRLDVAAKVTYRTIEARDQFTILGVRPRAGRWGGMPMTPKQREVLERAKVKGIDQLDKGAASQVIDKIVQRRSQGLCTLPMATQLAARGFSPDLPMDVARDVLSEMTKYGWAKANHQAAKILEERPELAVESAA